MLFKCNIDSQNWEILQLSSSFPILMLAINTQTKADVIEVLRCVLTHSSAHGPDRHQAEVSAG
jgi:hypothetical protein